MKIPPTKVCNECQIAFSKPYKRSMKMWAKSRFCSILCRGAWQSRNAVGKLAHAWKDAPSYSAIHHWIRSWYGSADKCENRENYVLGFTCSEMSSRYQWAQKHGIKNKRSLGSYMQLCSSCHARYDADKEFQVKNFRQIIMNTP